MIPRSIDLTKCYANAIHDARSYTAHTRNKHLIIFREDALLFNRSIASTDRLENRATFVTRNQLEKKHTDNSAKEEEEVNAADEKHKLRFNDGM